MLKKRVRHNGQNKFNPSQSVEKIYQIWKIWQIRTLLGGEFGLKKRVFRDVLKQVQFFTTCGKNLPNLEDLAD